MADELKRLQGTWLTVSVRTSRGVRKPFSQDPRELVVEIRGNKIRYTAVDDGKVSHYGSTIWRLDPSATVATRRAQGSPAPWRRRKTRCFESGDQAGMASWSTDGSM